MKENNKFNFVLHRENFLTSEQCDELIQKFDESKPQKSGVAGTYEGSELNENVRKVQEVRLKNDVVLSDGFKLTKHIIMACEMSNLINFKFQLEKPYQLEDIVLLRYENTDKYDWHLDIGKNETSVRKISAIIQLSDEQDYEGGDLKFNLRGLDSSNGDTVMSPPPEFKQQGSLVIFPSFLWHKVEPITSGKRYSLVMWTLGEQWK